MIKWSFYFNEGSISSTVNEEEEDRRIMQSLDSTGILDIPNEKFDLYVNMALVKCTSREVVNDDNGTADPVSLPSENPGSN